MDTSKFRGVFTALLTPMQENGELDLQSLERLVEHQIGKGIKGFYVGGSTGEGFILTSEERMNVLETVVRAAKGRVTIIAHVGCISTLESIRLARHAEGLGVDAVSAVVPFYYKVGLKEIREHYEAIMSAAQLPMIVYHFPGATGVNLSLDFYEEMARHPQCLGVKFTSLNLFEMQQIRSRCGEGFLIWNGHDEVYAGGALMGADGAIGSTFNMMPGLFTELYRQHVLNKWDHVQALQEKANAVISNMLNYDVIPYEKYVLYLQGVIQNPAVRQPLKRFSPEEKAGIEAFFKSSEVLR
ncbi:MAG: N-acetylneuraminate lyase [Paenibacillus sp.]|jgi:N-acetylneuraminate lyase|nr:N-acetylneuraminate lyase [Paenibacillus sp.]